MITARTSSVDDTKALAASVAQLARPGDIIVLAGEMGSGKTAFAQGFAQGLGVKDTVTSPTFTLVRDYMGRIPMHHIDVYRLDHLQEVTELGLAELLDDGAVTLIEWGDVVLPVLPADFAEVRLQYGTDDDERHVAIRFVGRSWAGRNRAVWEALDRWKPPQGEEG
ncbi:MAG: tRNA (adenosine(37)-N6)-threonylcarbamoyltransferase complex ATPase subunit type 1 TsaE [Actinomycetota bacterium]